MWAVGMNMGCWSLLIVVTPCRLVLTARYEQSKIAVVLLKTREPDRRWHLMGGKCYIADAVQVQQGPNRTGIIALTCKHEIKQAHQIPDIETSHKPRKKSLPAKNIHLFRKQTKPSHISKKTTSPPDKTRNI